MAYTPKTWVCGETITDEGLNNIEEGIQEALAGGGSSLPEVTSADDGKVLTVVDGEWDKADKDFKCSSDTIFNGSVTTSGSSTHTASFTLAKAIVADSVVVTFNGTEYECKVREEQGTGSTILQVMGGNSTESFPGYPFRISVVKNATSATIYTAANGTYTLNITKVSAETSDCFETAVKSVVEVGYNCVGDDVETSECFEKAVNKVADKGYECTENVQSLTNENVTTVYDAVSHSNWGLFSYANQITAKSIRVTFDGTEYNFDLKLVNNGEPANGYGGVDAWGNPDFFDYPFGIVSFSDGMNILFTQSAGTYSVKVESVTESVTTSECFDKAVRSIAGYECKEKRTTITNESVSTSGGTGEFDYVGFINVEEVIITIDDVEYKCKGYDAGYADYKATDYGDKSFVDFPFAIESSQSEINTLYMPTDGTYSVKIEVAEDVIDTSDCFEKAVKKIADKGYECKETYTSMLEEDVVTTSTGADSEGQFAYTDLINADKVRVTFDGTEYECEVHISENPMGKVYEYGNLAGDYSDFPFHIVSEDLTPAYNSLYTPTAGTHTVKIETATLTAETSECFCKAVNECVDLGYECSSSTAEIVCLDDVLTTIDDTPYFDVEFFPAELIGDTDTIIVIFDGTEYELPKNPELTPPQYGYGEYDYDNWLPIFTNYPCYIENNFGMYMLYTQSEGTYSIKITKRITSETIQTSECFEKAVKKFGLKNIIDAPNGGIIEGNLQDDVPLSDRNVATGLNAHAEGTSTTASDSHAHAEGLNTTASGYGAHAEGIATVASNSADHAEGTDTVASGGFSHAEGQETVASSSSAHAEGYGTVASRSCAHAEGTNTVADGASAHAEGKGTIANARSQHVFGEYNIAEPHADERGTYVEIVGNGLSPSSRSNARTLDWSGNETIAGTLTQSSDRRLKEHIDYLGEDAEEFIRSLKPAHYTKDDRHHVGFYAQDVEEVDEWNCMTGEMNGYMTLGYIEIIAPLVAYCQSLEERIKKLENK